jgi:exodeoxyribonuclease-3
LDSNITTEVELMPHTTTLLSWNVNGARAVYRKGFMDWFVETRPDILCLQETRAEEGQLPRRLAQPEGYHAYWNPSQTKKGYSGTALISKTEPLSVSFGLGVEAFDQEGRTIVARYPDLTLINCYFPNGGRDHGRVPFKLAFYDAFLALCERLRDQGETVIFCGDVNTAHQEIDLARPQSNQNTTGFLPEERAWLDQVVEAGYVDTFRHLYPTLTEQYTWWSMPTRARERNVGWRIDYFFIVQEALDRVVDAFILPEVMGSDHCPVGLRLNR